ncbi:hypothetical protein HMPREF0742_00659 [Rothia aeria F0184]|uniref:Uncharacterized protein n=1 Tax=Rothia aeria F0184 TaxID=888019 RepID=U7V7D7_9MICC|nr:hypothetical protein HMPREF0742_00659 [Rothia aeria F0184]
MPLTSRFFFSELPSSPHMPQSFYIAPAHIFIPIGSVHHSIYSVL